MINPADRHRVGQARLLRRQGKTYDEIRAAIGLVEREQLRRWLKGIPRPAATYRSAPMTELRRTCRRLRAQGLTYEEIREVTGASTGSMSLWLRDMPIARDDPAALRHRTAALDATWDRLRAAKARDRQASIDDIAGSVGDLTDRDLLLIGAAIYWAEGTKSKPWRVKDRVQFINSDPSMIQMFLRWLALFGIGAADCSLRVHIHESADVEGAELYWAELADIAVTDLGKTTVKRHNPTTVRYNTGETYRGCLSVDVHRSGPLYRRVEGLWAGISQCSVNRRVGTAF